MIRVLVVDDDPSICSVLSEVLGRAGYDVSSAASGEEALEILRNTRFDVLVSDLKLGGRIDGMRLLQQTRWRWPRTAIVMLTAHGTLDSALTAIREGVDGYLLKPVQASELRQVIREALLERQDFAVHTPSESRPNLLTHGSLSVDVEQHLVYRDGKSIELTPQELDLLVYLMENAGRVVGPKELVQAAHSYTPDTVHEARQLIKWYVYQLRQKIESDPSNPRFVLNVRGVGYTLGR
ncbi:MAG: hypothetical protein A2Y73_08405 [Chloroflexi bacterium RBG_13_56_8]|nr:MAG: hypothetical protein A2Y73_08405 [Chloroflexi bacterium RBG_13_56_8]